MPRIVNLPTSDYSSEEENANDHISCRDSNQISVYRTTTSKERYLNSNYSHYSMPIVHFKEDEIYCLSRIVCGKVRKFKKDSRVWLHKSSERAKLKRKQLDCSHPSNPPVINEPKSSFERIYDKENCPNDEQKNVRFESDTKISIAENYNVCGKGNSNKRENTVHNETNIDEDYMFIGDSDADLTYSEEESPVKATSYVEIWRQKGQVNMLGSKSADSIYKRVNETVERNDSCQSIVSSRCSCEQDSSFENLDIYNESGNSNRDAPNATDLSRKLAPAIEIERESYRENILDYAVNKHAANVPDDMKMYCEDIYRIARLRQKATCVPVCSSGGSGRQLSPCPRPVAATTSSYNLRVRRLNTDQNGVQEEMSNNPAIKKRRPTGKPAQKRARLNTQAEQVTDSINENTAIGLPNSNPEIKKQDTGDDTVPSCSRDYVIRKTPQSLFIIAGFVLYGLFKCNIDTQ